MPTLVIRFPLQVAAGNARLCSPVGRQMEFDIIIEEEERKGRVPDASWAGLSRYACC